MLPVIDRRGGAPSPYGDWWRRRGASHKKEGFSREKKEEHTCQNNKKLMSRE